VSSLRDPCIQSLVVPRHTAHGEPFLHPAAAGRAVDPIDASDGVDERVVIVADEAGLLVSDDLRRRPAPARDHRCAERHRLGHGETEGLGPENGEEQATGIAEEFGLADLVDFSDELDAWMVEPRLYLLLEVLAIHPIHLGGENQADARAARGIDRNVRPLLGRDAAEEDEVVTAAGARIVAIERQAVMHGRQPVHLAEGWPLCVADRDEGELGKAPIERGQPVDVQPAMQRRQHGKPEAPQRQKRQEVEVVVDHVELVGAFDQLQSGDQAPCTPIDPGRRLQADRAASHRDEVRTRARIAAGEEGDLVTTADELRGEPIDDPLGAAVKGRRNRLRDRCELCDAHVVFVSFPALVDPLIP